MGEGRQAADSPSLASHSVMLEWLASRTTNAYGKHPNELAPVLRHLHSVEPLLRHVASPEADGNTVLDQALERILGQPPVWAHRI